MRRPWLTLTSLSSINTSHYLQRTHPVLRLGKAAGYCNPLFRLQYAIHQSALEPSETGHVAGSCISVIPLLHLAIFEKCSTDFLGFLANKVNVDAWDNTSEQTAHSTASSVGFWRVVDTLLNHEADPKLANSYGHSPLSHTARKFILTGPPEREEVLKCFDMLSLIFGEENILRDILKTVSQFGRPPHVKSASVPKYLGSRQGVNQPDWIHSVELST